MSSSANDTSPDGEAKQIRAKLGAAVKRRDKGRAEVEAADAQIGEAFALAIDCNSINLKDLAADAGVSRTTAYAMARRSPTSSSGKMGA